MQPIHRLLAVLIAMTACAAGQEPREHTCRILFLDRPTGAPENLFLFDGVSSQKIELPKMNLSPVYKLRPGPLKLHLLPAPVENPEAMPAGAPSVTVAETSIDFYLLVASDPANSIAPVSMRLVNANGDHLGRGQMMWFNLSDKIIGGTIGREKLMLRPGERSVVKEPITSKGDYPVDLYFLMKGDDFVHPLCETQWRHDPRSRSLVFVIPEKKRRMPRIFAFSDFRMPETNSEP